jgi:acetoacetate decarboxylase
MKIEDVKNAFAMPLTSPSALKTMDYRFNHREYLIIQYETDEKALQRVVPEPLQLTSNVVKFEFMRMPDAHGFGRFSEAGQIIEVEYAGQKGGYAHSMYLDNLAPIVAGREIWGFPKKYGSPALTVDTDTLKGSLDYHGTRVAIGTMGYKYQPLDLEKTQKQMTTSPNFLLKIIPHANGQQAAICQLVKYHLENVWVHGAWTGPAALELFAHALAPVNELPVRQILSGSHIIADLSLGFGEVVYDYLA